MLASEEVVARAPDDRRTARCRRIDPRSQPAKSRGGHDLRSLPLALCFDPAVELEEFNLEIGGILGTVAAGSVTRFGMASTIVEVRTTWTLRRPRPHRPSVSADVVAVGLEGQHPADSPHDGNAAADLHPVRQDAGWVVRAVVGVTLREASFAPADRPFAEAAPALPALLGDRLAPADRPPGPDNVAVLEWHVGQ